MSAGDYVWYEFGETDDALYLNITGGVATFRIWNGGDVFTRTFSFTAALAMTFTVDVPLQQITIAGATTGNGTQGATFAFAAGDGSLDIGQYHTGIQVMPGTFGVVEDFSSAITCTAAATVPELVVAATSSLTIASTGAIVVPELQVSASGLSGTTITTNLLLGAQPLGTTLADGAWPDVMRTTAWRVTVTPSFASSSLALSERRQIFTWSGTGVDIEVCFINISGSVRLVGIRNNSIFIDLPSVTFSASQSMTLEMDFSVSRLSLVGATTGDGEVTQASSPFASGSSMLIGVYSGGVEAWTGTIGAVHTGAIRVASPTVSATGTLTITCTAAVSVAAPQVSAAGSVSITSTAAVAVPALVVAATCVNQSTITCTGAIVVPALLVETEPRLLIPTALTVYAPDGTTVVDVEGTINDDGAPRLSVDRVRNALRRGELLTQDDETF